MPHEQLDATQAAAYMGVRLDEVEKWASRDKIPCRKVGGRLTFIKEQVDHWLWEQMHTLDSRALKAIEQGVSTHHGIEADGPLVCPLIPREGLACPLPAKTRDSVLRELISVADAHELIYDASDVLEHVAARESLCSTALLRDVAFPHPHRPLPYAIAESFVVVGLAPSGVPFGADDGGLTRLFFLICCKDERTHLHLLARLMRMLEKRDVIEQLLESETAVELADHLAGREMQVLSHDG